MSVELPPYVAKATRHLPLFPLERILQMAAKKAYAKHQEKLDRLLPYLDQQFAINPTDLDWQAQLSFCPDGPQLKLTRNTQMMASANVRISAPLLVLLELLEGQSDGDAHFFSRDLIVEGNTEAVLALRNTLDNAEIDFLAEVTALFGPLALPLRQLFTQTSHLLRKNHACAPPAVSSQNPMPRWREEDDHQGLYPT